MDETIVDRSRKQLKDLDDRSIRFLTAFIEPPDENGCQVWTGPMSGGGVPSIVFDSRHVNMRHLMAELGGAEVGELPLGTWNISPVCNTGACVRFHEAHNKLVRFRPSPTEEEKEEARRRWLAAGKTLDAACEKHGASMETIFIRGSTTPRVYMRMQCRGCKQERANRRSAAAAAKRRAVVFEGGTEMPLASNFWRGGRAIRRTFDGASTQSA